MCVWSDSDMCTAFNTECNLFLNKTNALENTCNFYLFDRNLLPIDTDVVLPELYYMYIVSVIYRFANMFLSIIN